MYTYAGIHFSFAIIYIYVLIKAKGHVTEDCVLYNNFLSNEIQLSMKKFSNNYIIDRHIDTAVEFSKQKLTLENMLLIIRFLKISGK